jgi:hypothetical protein
MNPEATKYINSIRNLGKHEYARKYWACVVYGGKSPDYKEFQISYMAAQAVRMRLEEFAR